MALNGRRVLQSLAEVPDKDKNLGIDSEIWEEDTDKGMHSAAVNDTRWYNSVRAMMSIPTQSHSQLFSED